MFDTLFAWFEIPVVFYAYLFGVAGMVTLYIRNFSDRDKDIPVWVWYPYKAIYCAFVATIWPIIVMSWIFQRMLLWSRGA